MKYTLTLLLTCLCLAGCEQTTSTPVGLGQLSQDGRTIVINYWAIWCHPCREEIPELNEFAEDYAAQISIYAVNFDGVIGEELVAQAAVLGINFTLLEEDPSLQLGYARPMVLPTTLIITPDGEIKARLLGPQTSDSLAAALK
jgi:thiol-disulfide isomerase/thioredoxin